MRRWLLLAIAISAVAFASSGVQAKTGIVLLHGKQGTPEYTARRVVVISGLADALQGAGYLVERPEMCWSRARIYDSAYLDCFRDIDGAIAKLKSQGADAIVVAGMSLGGNAVLGYGARTAGLTGIIAIAPAPAPEKLIRNNPEIAASVARAQSLMAAGAGTQTADFSDTNNGAMFEVHITPQVYLSFFAPEGPANIGVNIAQLKAPFLLVSGTADKSQPYVRAQFVRAPANPLNKLVEVDSGHLGTPAAGTAAILAWLPTVRH